MSKNKDSQEEISISSEKKVKNKKFTIDQDEWENYLRIKVVGKAVKLISAILIPAVALLSYFGLDFISDAKKMTQSAKDEIQTKMVVLDSLVQKSTYTINYMTVKTQEFKEFQESYQEMMGSYVNLMINNVVDQNKIISSTVADMKNLTNNINEKEKNIDERLKEYENLKAEYHKLKILINDTLNANLQRVEDLSRLVDEKLVPELILIKEGDYGISKVANVRMKYIDGNSKDYIKSLQIVDLEAKRGDNEELKKYSNPIKKDTSIDFDDLDGHKYNFKINFIESGQEKKHGNYIVVEINKSNNSEQF